LHKESISWLEEIDFWKDELEFLYKVLSKRLATSSFPLERLAELQKDLINIQSSTISFLREKIKVHEQALFPLLQKIESSDEENSRTEHKNLLKEKI
jgi:hypothetical protein